MVKKLKIDLTNETCQDFSREYLVDQREPSPDDPHDPLNPYGPFEPINPWKKRPMPDRLNA